MLRFWVPHAVNELGNDNVSIRDKLKRLYEVFKQQQQQQMEEQGKKDQKKWVKKEENDVFMGK